MFRRLSALLTAPLLALAFFATPTSAASPGELYTTIGDGQIFSRDVPTIVDIPVTMECLPPPPEFSILEKTMKVQQVAEDGTLITNFERHVGPLRLFCNGAKHIEDFQVEALGSRPWVCDDLAFVELRVTLDVRPGPLTILFKEIITLNCP